MKNNIYAIFDEKAESYNAPFPLQSDGLAKRSFQEACKDSRTDLYKYPNDFRLYCIATWDSVTGEYENVIPPRFICQNSQEIKNTIAEEIEKIEEGE